MPDRTRSSPPLTRMPACTTSRVDRPMRASVGERRRASRSPHAVARGQPTTRRPSNARPSVTSSAYSRSPPTGSPEASRVTADLERVQQAAEVGRRRLALEVRVGRDDDLVHGAVGEPLHELRMRRSSGPMPSIGLIAPPSTWYSPRNSRVRSIADDVLRLLDDADERGSRRGSRQIEQRSCSVTLPQISQNRTLSRTSARISREARHVEVLGLQDVERDALRRLRADAGKAAELVDQLLDDAVVHGLPRSSSRRRVGRLDLFEEGRAEHLAHDGLAVALDAAVGGLRRAGGAGDARAARRRARAGPDRRGSTSSAAHRRRRARRRWRRIASGLGDASPSAARQHRSPVARRGRESSRRGERAGVGGALRARRRRRTGAAAPSRRPRGLGAGRRRRRRVAAGSPLSRRPDRSSGAARGAAAGASDRPGARPARLGGARRRRRRRRGVGAGAAARRADRPPSMLGDELHPDAEHLQDRLRRSFAHALRRARRCWNLGDVVLAREREREHVAVAELARPAR